MSGRAYSHPGSQSDEFRHHTDFMRWELAPDERVGPPLKPRGRWRRWLAIIVLILGGASWTMIEDKPAARAWLSAQATSAVQLARAMMGEGDRKPAPPEQPPPELAALRLLEPELIRSALAGQLPPQPEIVASTIAAGPEPEVPATKREEEAAEPDTTVTAAEPERPAPLPPLPPLTDPLQKKAEAAGLHPELSRALLQSLTATDFKNAAAAIKKAIAETPEDGVLVWPPKPPRGSARFRVHFVPGISPACRRYVVGVAKSGWLTTALPMERCGVTSRFARSQTARRGAQLRADHH